MTRLFEFIGAATAFLLFQAFGSDYFPTTTGGVFAYTWERGIAAVVATTCGVGLGHLIGNLLTLSGSDS
jgi:hypothetical protein